MFQLGSEAARQAPQFVPDGDARDWIGDTLGGIAARLGAVAQRPRMITSTPGGALPRDLDGLFELICRLQDEVDQSEVEFTLLEVESQSDLPDDFRPLGDPTGQMLHAFARGPRGGGPSSEYVLLFAPAVFRLPQLLFASVARELGRLGLHRSGGYLVGDAPEDPADWEAESELAAIAMGMGVWVANGAYVYENSCCGGGCGVDLRSLRAGLSVPEVGYALALDCHRKGIGRWGVGRHLEPTQRAAFRKSWGVARKAPVPASLSAAATAGELVGG